MNEKGEGLGRMIVRGIAGPVFFADAFVRILWEIRKENAFEDKTRKLSEINASILRFEGMEKSSDSRVSARAASQLRRLRSRQTDLAENLRRLKDRMD